MAAGEYTPFPNDRFELSDLPRHVLQGIDFWADHTPDEPAIKVPWSELSDQGYATITWKEWRQLRRQMAVWFITHLGLDDQPPQADTQKETIAFVVNRPHQVIVPWPALSALGYTCQFLSPLQSPAIVAEMIAKTAAKHVLHSGIEENWLDSMAQELKSVCGANSPKLTRLEDPLLAPPQLRALREGDIAGSEPIVLNQHVPEPFVILHSFGSTSKPKLYRITASVADDSAHTSALAVFQYPPQRRWRCQLITSVSAEKHEFVAYPVVINQLTLLVSQMPFHYSFQNPIWRTMVCGTTAVFPYMAHKQDLFRRFTPDAVDILQCLSSTRADTLYCSPNGLESMLELGHQDGAPAHWPIAIRHLKDAHTGAAPVSVQKAECFERYGLNVFQVFAMTEAGLMFYAGKELTGDTTWLQPVEEKKSHMLWYREDLDSNVYQLWLAIETPALKHEGLTFEPFPGDPTRKAWNTLDTFKPAPRSDLWTFAGRQDDWIRCTNGAACRALEVEAQVLKDLRRKVGFQNVVAVAVIGTGRPYLCLVVERKEFDCADEAEKARQADLWSSCIAEALAYVNAHLLHWPLVLTVDRVIWTTPEQPIRMTTKGSMQRKFNEELFWPKVNTAEAQAQTSTALPN